MSIPLSFSRRSLLLAGAALASAGLVVTAVAGPAWATSPGTSPAPIPAFTTAAVHGGSRAASAPNGARSLAAANARIEKRVDRLTRTLGKLAARVPALQARISAAQARGTDTSGATAALADLQAKLADAQAKLSGLVPGVHSGSTSVADARSVLRSVQPDVKAIRSDIRTIRETLWSAAGAGRSGLRRGSGGSSAPRVPAGSSL